MMVTAKLVRDDKVVLSMDGDVSKTGDTDRLIHELYEKYRLEDYGNNPLSDGCLLSLGKTPVPGT